MIKTAIGVASKFYSPLYFFHLFFIETRCTNKSHHNLLLFLFYDMEPTEPLAFSYLDNEALLHFKSTSKVLNTP